MPIEISPLLRKVSSEVAVGGGNLFLLGHQIASEEEKVPSTMGTDPIEDFWIDGGGSDSELQYALDGFRVLIEFTHLSANLTRFGLTIETERGTKSRIGICAVEKNELREEKMRLKADKDRLEQQIMVLNVPPAGFFPHPIAFHPATAPAAFVPQFQAPADKTTPFSGFPGMAMWQWLPPAVMDTTQDPKLWPPNA
ncbi:hypothetical protein GW17_00023331 [Ensete ventricosum]|nr:hypothetical protein GW17_00023331 [Ensete ventricosum]